MAQLDNVEDAIKRFKENENRVDVFVNETGSYSTNEAAPRQVETLPSFMGRISTEFYAVLESLGYEAPVTFASGIVVERPTQTIEYGGNVFTPVSTSIPFTTTSVFTASQWKLVQYPGSLVFVEKFGAKDGQDCTDALEAAFAYASANKGILSSGYGTYKTTRPLKFSGVGGVNLRCKIVGDYPHANGPIVTWYEPATVLTGPRGNFINFVMWRTASDDLPTIRLAGLKSTSVHIGEAGRVQLYANTVPADQSSMFGGKNTYSFAYNAITIDVLSTLDIIGVQDGENLAWVNENTIHCERFRSIASGLNSGIVIQGSYPHNHNKITRGTMEGRHVIDIQTGSSNIIEDMRFERNPSLPTETLTINFGSNTWNNHVVATWLSSPGFVNSPYGTGTNQVFVNDSGFANTVSHIQEQYCDDVCLFELSGNTPFVSSINKGVTSYLNQNTDIEGTQNIKHLLNGSFKFLSDFGNVFDRNGKIPAFKGLMFSYKADAALFRHRIYIYDANGKLITKQPATMPLGGGALTWNAGGYYGIGANVNAGLFSVIDDSVVKFVRVVITGGSSVNGSTFGSLRLVARYPKKLEQAAREFHSLSKPIRKRSLMYLSDADISMSEIGEGLPCYKFDMSQMKINTRRTHHDIVSIVDNTINLTGTVQYVPIADTTLLYVDSSGNEQAVGIVSANLSSVTLASMPADMANNTTIALIVTKTKTLA